MGLENDSPKISAPRNRPRARSKWRPIDGTCSPDRPCLEPDGSWRLEKFLYKANAKKRAILAQTPIVAVQAAVLPASEAGSILRRIGRDGDFGTWGGSYPADQASRPVKFLLLFDSRTSQLVSEDGVLVLDTPQLGRIGVFGGVSALYIGAGW